MTARVGFVPHLLARGVVSRAGVKGDDMKTIERLKALEAKATGAPWHDEYGGGMYITGPEEKEVATACGCCDGCTGDNCENDRPFIIEMRNSLPALLAVVEAAVWLREVQQQRDYDESENAAAGQTYSVGDVNIATAQLDAALRAMEGGAG